MRNSLANIQFHESQKQTLLGKMDYAENQCARINFATVSSSIVAARYYMPKYAKIGIHSTYLSSKLFSLLYMTVAIVANLTFLLVRLREAEVEQEEAEAEVTHEKNQKLKEFKSEVEVKSAELDHIKAEVTQLSDEF